MKKLLLLLVTTVLMSPLSRAASVTYTYTGNPLTTDTCNAVIGVCELYPAYQVPITGTLTLAIAVPVGNPIGYYNEVVQSYSFTDGFTTYNNSNSSLANLMLAAAGTGDLSYFKVGLSSKNRPVGLLLTSYQGDTLTALDGPNTETLSTTAVGSFTLNATVPVTVPVAAVAVTPEPSSLALLGTGILGVASVLRRRVLNA